MRKLGGDPAQHVADIGGFLFGVAKGEDRDAGKEVFHVPGRPPFALPHRAVVAAAPAAGGRSRVRSVQEPGAPVEFSAASVVPGEVPGWAAYVAGTCWAFREAGYPVGEVELELDSSSGASSSGPSSSAIYV